MAIPENPITRKEHFLAKAAGESVNTPEPVTRVEMYLDAIASGSGGGGSGDNRFIVTCTPTKPDYSGTMVKTVGEIRTAYYSGKEIWFTIPPYSVPVSVIEQESNGVTFKSYMIMTTNNVLVVLETPDTHDALETDYDTTIYQLTPMGG